MKTTSIPYLIYLLLPWIFTSNVVIAQETVTESEATTTTTTTAESVVGSPSSSTTTTAEEEGTTSGGGDQGEKVVVQEEKPVQVGPFIDLFGPELYSLELLDESRAKLNVNYTNEVLAGKKVIGLYFSADWCGPCRQFTPDLVNFYKRMNNRRGKKDQFEIIWVSRCRDSNAYVQYFAHMPWLALPAEEAMGERGQWLSQKYKTKGIPHLVLLDDLGNTITIDGRTKIPQDKTGIGFP